MTDDWKWPNKAKLAVSLTFDVDAEAPYLGMDQKFEGYLSTLSDATFGITRGLPRILHLLDQHRVPASFYVPGETARRHPDALEAILRQEHEVGHHGDMHRPVHLISPELQREEIEKGLDALSALGAPKPRGYRSPSFEMTIDTFLCLHEHSFLYDSSLMGDDRPYLAQYAGKSMLELPVTWTLDDWPLVGFSSHYPAAKLASPEVLLSVWLAEYQEARDEGRHVSFTMHPEVIGRSSRFRAFRTLLETMLSDGDVWFARMEDVAMHVRAKLVTDA